MRTDSGGQATSRAKLCLSLSLSLVLSFSLFLAVSSTANTSSMEDWKAWRARQPNKLFGEPSQLSLSTFGESKKKMRTAEERGCFTVVDRHNVF